jgi:hypothetical protein
MRFRLKSETGALTPAFRDKQSSSMNLMTTLYGARLAVTYHAVAGASARISLMDIAGKTVRSFVDENSAVGSRSVSLDVRNLRQGIYFVAVEHTGIRETQSITIVH